MKLPSDTQEENNAMTTCRSHRLPPKCKAPDPIQHVYNLVMGPANVPEDAAPNQTTSDASVHVEDALTASSPKVPDTPAKSTFFAEDTHVHKVIPTTLGDETVASQMSSVTASLMQHDCHRNAFNCLAFNHNTTGGLGLVNKIILGYVFCYISCNRSFPS